MERLTDEAADAATPSQPVDVPPFGAWLLAQDKSREWYADLAKAAKADPKFPRRGEIVAVHGRMIINGADGDTIAMLDDAIADWRRAGGQDDIDLSLGL